MDVKLFKVIHSFAGSSQNLDWLIIFFAKFLPVILVVAAIIFIISRKNPKTIIFTFSMTAMSLILSRGFITETIRFFYNRPRPFEVFNFIPLVNETSGSFPSGHAAFFFALASIIFFLNHKTGNWFFVFAFINALARVAAGIHWPLDIIGGAVVGILSFFAIKLIVTNETPLLKDSISRNA